MLFLLLSLANASPVQVWIDLSNREHKAIISQRGMGFLEKQQGTWMLFEAEEDILAFLEEQKISFRLHTKTHRSRPRVYASAQQMRHALAVLADEYPELVEYHQLGTSVEGRAIIALRISRTSTPRLSFRILGAHHGDELSSAAVGYQFAEEILQRSEEAELSQWLGEHAIWIVPHVNPDGVDAFTRYNSHDVDLNRNYSYRWSAAEWRSGDYPFSEPESNAIRVLEEWNSFTAGLSLHSGASNLSWVWNYNTIPSVDDALLQTIAEDYAAHCSQPGFWLINGADWYVTHGDTTDWSYGIQGTFDFTLELSVNKSPPAGELSNIIEYHMPSMLNYIQWPYWIAADVRDVRTGRPIFATWTMLEDGWTTNSGPQGHISRLVEGEGPWTVEISAPGYEPQVVGITTGVVAEIELSRSDLHVSLQTSCSFHQRGEVRLELPDEISQVALYRGSEWVASMEKDGGWEYSGSELRSGLYHLHSDAGWFPNHVIINDDQREVLLSSEQHSFFYSGEKHEGESFWRVSGNDLYPLVIGSDEDNEREILLSSFTEEDCFFRVGNGELSRLMLQYSESEASIEPSVEEPASHPAAEPSLELEVGGKGGCQTLPLKRTPCFLWSMVILSMSIRRKGRFS